MASFNARSINTLNSLIEVTLDSAHGYRDAAKETKNPRFKSLFERRSIERDRLTKELQVAVRDLGATPEEDGTMMAPAHRLFLNLKNAVGGSDESIVDQVEAGEDHIIGKFQDALNDDELSATSKSVIQTVYAVIKSGHDEMRDIKHGLESHRNA